MQPETSSHLPSFLTRYRPHDVDADLFDRTVYLTCAVIETTTQATHTHSLIPLVQNPTLRHPMGVDYTDSSLASEDSPGSCKL